MTMAKKNITLSAEAQAIIDAFVSDNVLNPMSLYNLVGELYSRRENARQDIISSVKDLLMSSPLGLSEANLTILEAEYINVLKYCHDALAKIEGLYSDKPFHLPYEFCDLISRLIESKKEDSVFLPLAGYAEMAFHMDVKSISGFEFNSWAWAFDNIFLDAYGINGEIKRQETINDDSLEVLLSEQLTGARYKHVVSFPPHISTKEDKHIAKYMQYVLENEVEEGGDMCLILPLSYLTEGPWSSFQRFLAQNSMSYNVAVISLPSILLPVTTMKVGMLIIEKSHNADNTFYFMDADRPEFFPEFYYSFATDPAPRHYLKAELILETLRHNDIHYVKSVYVDDVLKENPTFAPARFFFDEDLPKLREGFKYIQLKSLIVDQTHPSEYNKDGYVLPQRSGKYIRISHLYDNPLMCTIDYSNIIEAPIPFSAYAAYANGGYAAYLNGKIKVGKITDMYSSNGRDDLNNPNSDSTVVKIDNSVFHFVPKTNSGVLLDYILRELMSDYVLAQAKRFAFGFTKQQMLKRDFLQLKIAVPSIEVQDEILKQDKIDAIAKAGAQLDEMSDKFRKDVHMMKHGIGQTVFNLGNWMKMLNYARKVGNGVVDDSSEIGGLVKVKVADIYDNIDAALRVLNRQINTFDIGTGMQTSKFSLTDFIDKYIEEHKRPHVRFDFPSQQHRAEADVPLVDIDNSDGNDMKVIAYPGEFAVRKSEANDFIEFSEKALDIIFENIVSNAVAHGFTDPDKEYVIRFDFVPEGTNYVLTISNNGAPLASDKVASEIFVWGKTYGGKDHAGIGGYQVKDLMEHFGGKAEIISTPEEEFTVTYKLTFTKTNLLNINL